METRVLIDENQQVTEEDFNNFGLFPQRSFDNLVKGLLIPDRAIWGFPVVETAPTEVTVGEGRLASDGAVYFNDDAGGVIIPLLTHVPVSSRKIVSVVTWGVEAEAELEPRTFLTDPDTEATQATPVSTVMRRRAQVGIVAGLEGSDPTEPVIPANYVRIANVTLTTTGVESIADVVAERAPNLRTLQTLAGSFGTWRTQIGGLVDTLSSQVAALSNAQRGFAKAEMAVRIAADLARVKDRVDLPDEFTNWAADHFLTEDNSDPDHPDYLALVEEGIRFPYAQALDAQIGLLNPADTQVVAASNFMLPAYDLVARVSVLGRDGEIGIGAGSFQTLNIVQKTRTRTRIRYGTPFDVCENVAYWHAGQYDSVNKIFKRAGDTFVDLGIIANKDWQGHQIHRLQQKWVDTITEYYWDRITTAEGINGVVNAQSFLNSTEGWLMGLDLYFTRKHTSGDVTVLIVETTNGSPDPTKVIARATLAYADVKVLPLATRVLFAPTAVKQGARYAWITLTGANHWLATVNNNKFTGGSRFTSTDGSWFLGDTASDFAMQLVYAKFRSNRVEVQLNPLQLAGGIAAVDINVDSAIPPGTELIWEAQFAGVWKALDPTDPNLFTGLPALLNFRVVFLGTLDLMPGIGVGSKSRLLTWRPRTDLQHISEDRNMDAPINTVYITLRIGNWRGAPYHEVECTLLYDTGFSTIKTPDVVEDEPAPDDPDNDLIRKLTFTFGTSIDAYKISIDATTDNVVLCQHIAERVDVGLTI